MGDNLKAIKLYRELYGVGLQEAKDAIDAIRIRPWFPSILGQVDRVA